MIWKSYCVDCDKCGRTSKNYPVCYAQDVLPEARRKENFHRIKVDGRRVDMCSRCYTTYRAGHQR